MKGSMVKRGRQCDVTVTKTHLRCTLKTNLGPNTFLDIPLSDILAVQTPSRDSSNIPSPTASSTTSASTSAPTASSSSCEDNNNQSVVVHYAGRRKDSHNLTWEKLLLSGDSALCSELSTVCNCTITGPGVKGRHLLVLINPFSGRKSAGRLFHKKVAPLLRACGLSFTAHETRGPGDAAVICQDLDFSTIDGVLTVGGDGFYSEVLTALMSRQQQLSGLSPDDPDVGVAPLPVPVGLIPGGTGNYVAMYLHGTKDPVTAAIRVVMGKTTTSNVVGVYQGGKLHRCAGLICCFGLLGDIMHECERFRWMGSFRYKVIPLRAILGRRPIPGRVDYLHAPSGEWREASGTFYNLDLNVVDLVDNGARLVPTFGAESNILHLTSDCSLGDHIKGLKKVEDWATGAFSFPFIQSEPVLRLRVTLDPGTGTAQAAAGEARTQPESSRPTDRPLDGATYYINCDGEALAITRTQFELRIYPSLVRLFGESPPQ
ncbi:hypothetical protein EGW08_011760 [Elysia chlorotica]|uniref:DAGKc domain-containing protein n=1 Tax=Elysia chlorotica TaxID=188477 RepID=A0A3S1BCR7_ELYCH|nr:hypothetical protein EGW08_011760 [Elysia chlorotica]